MFFIWQHTKINKSKTLAKHVLGKCECGVTINVGVNVKFFKQKNVPTNFNEEKITCKPKKSHILLVFFIIISHHSTIDNC